MRPPARAPCALPPGTGAETVSSTSVFQAPHPSHLPAHLAWTVPQDWQTKAEEGRDMGLGLVGSLRRGAGRMH